jgi:hypothetical protein
VRIRTKSTTFQRTAKLRRELERMLKRKKAGRLLTGSRFILICLGEAELTEVEQAQIAEMEAATRDAPPYDHIDRELARLIAELKPTCGLNMANGNGGSPGTWEILSSPQRNPGRSYRVTNSRPRRRTRPPGSETNE